MAPHQKKSIARLARPQGPPVSQLLATDLSCHVSQLSLHEEGTTAVKIHRRDRQIQIYKNLTGETQLACWFVISCCIMFIWRYIHIIYIYISLNVVDWYSILGRHCRSSLAGQTRLRWKMSFQHVSKSFPVCPVSPLACMITCSRFSVCVWFSIRLTCRIWLRTPLSLACGGHVAGSPTGKMILLSVGQEVCWYVLINDLPVRFSYCRSKTRGVPTSSVIIEHQPTTWFDMCGSEISTSPTIFGWWVQAQRTFALRHQFHKGLGGWIFNEVISVTTSMLQFRSVADSQVLKFLYPTQMSCIVVAGGNRSIWTMY